MDTDQSRPHDRWLAPSMALNRFKHRQVAYAADYSDPEGHLYYGFLIGDVGLLVPHAVTSEVVESPPVSALPDAPDWFVGLCNLRGSVIPVYQIASFLDTQTNTNEDKKLLVIGNGDGALGILISGLPQPLKLADKHVMAEMPPVPERLGESVTKVYAKDQRVWFEFDLDRFFSAIAARAVERHPA